MREKLKSKTKRRRLAIALLIVLLAQCVTVAFFSFDSLLLVDRMEEICIFCGQINLRQGFGFGGRFFHGTEQVIIPPVTALLSHGDCRHGWHRLSTKSILIGHGLPSGISLHWKSRGTVVDFLDDKILGEALWRILPTQPHRASAAVRWLIESKITGNLSVSTNYEAVARSGDVEKVSKFLLGAPSRN